MSGEGDRKDVKYTGLATGGPQDNSDLRTWHLNTQEIVSSPYSKKKQVRITYQTNCGWAVPSWVIIVIHAYFACEEQLLKY